MTPLYKLDGKASIFAKEYIKEPLYPVKDGKCDEAYRIWEDFLYEIRPDWKPGTPDHWRALEEIQDWNRLMSYAKDGDVLCEFATSFRPLSGCAGWFLLRDDRLVVSKLVRMA